MDGLCLNTGIIGIPPPIGGLDVRTSPAQVSAVASSASKKAGPFSMFSFRYPTWPRRRGGGSHGGVALDDAVLSEEKDVSVGGGDDVAASETGNWILKILHVRSLWGGDGEQRKSFDGGDGDCDGGCRVSSSDDDDDEEEEEESEFDRDSFSRLLRRVSLSEARLFAQLSYLGNIAYCISKIQTENLLRCYNLRYVTSSIDKREFTSKAEKSSQGSEEVKEVKEKDSNDETESNLNQISASNAYQIAASAASYLHLGFGSRKSEENDDLVEECCEGLRSTNMSSEMASLMASTDSVTAVVAAKEEVKQAVADDLNSTHSSPCEWYVCDDDENGTRFFAIQGSETLASWQANLLFEPVKFEGLDVIVHRGIYEAAKGMYEQMLPEIRSHLKSRGERGATFRFTGHSLGGSLALLVNLMLLIRNEVPVSSLLPVITFGSPSIMCGGDRLLQELGLPRSHVKAITMHRDIVPRAFSCHYPSHVAEFLKAVNGNFRNHPCLNSQNVLYTPMGELLILQPDEKFSPSHHLLPAGIGLYVLTSPPADPTNSEKRSRAAKVFLNSPHPLEILRDRAAYGPEGAVQRDHDMNSYLKCVRGFIRQELSRVRKAKREHRRRAWWPIVSPQGVRAGIVVSGGPVTPVAGQEESNFSGIVRTGHDSLRRFSRLVASQHMHLFVVLLFPARLLLFGSL